MLFSFRRLLDDSRSRCGNLLLCSAFANSGSQALRANAVMRANCIRHLVKIVEILQPTLVISQGLGRVNALWESLGVTHQVNPNLAECYLADCDLNGNRFAWVALKHPTRALEVSWHY